METATALKCFVLYVPWCNCGKENRKQLWCNISIYVGVMHKVKHYISNQARVMLYDSLVNPRA